MSGWFIYNVRFDNPIFACLEIDCQNSDADVTGQAFKDLEKVLTFYELDLGLNHVVRKSSDAVEFTANHLVAIPGHKDGPGGVLVCSEGMIEWRHMDFEKVRIPIPNRSSDMNAQKRGMIYFGSSTIVYRIFTVSIFGSSTIVYRIFTLSIFGSSTIVYRIFTLSIYQYFFLIKKFTNN
jgi:splicing factor 3B subunit 3